MVAVTALLGFCASGRAQALIPPRLLARQVQQQAAELRRLFLRFGVSGVGPEAVEERVGKCYTIAWQLSATEPRLKHGLRLPLFVINPGDFAAWTPSS